MDHSERRVVVTGLGMVTPVGSDVESTWESLLHGRGGVGPISLFDAGTFPTRIAAELKEFRLATYLGDGAVRWEKHGRNTQIALAAGGQAIEQSGLLDYEARDSTRFGVYLGAGESQQDFPRIVDLIKRSSTDGKVDTSAFTSIGMGLLNRLNEAEQEPGTPAAHLASVFGARGPNLSCLTACAASARRLARPSRSSAAAEPT